MLDIFIVSLKSDLKRREVISSFLINCGLHFDFIDAIYGKEIKDSDFLSLPLYTAESRLNRKLTHGEVGCTLSHLRVYNSIIEGDNDWVCILEDDALLTPEFASFITSFDKDKLKLLPNNLYLLGGQNGIFQSRYIAKSRLTKINVGGVYFHKTIGSNNYIFRTCCYLMNKEMAAKIISLSKENFFVSDDWSYFSKLGIIKDIYLSDIVHHPLDLSGSHLEAERLVSFDDSSNSSQSCFHKIKWHFIHRLTLISSFFKTFMP